jgi:hypothetical protein
LHRPRPAEADVYARAQELDATLRDAMQDFGLDLDVADPGPSPDKMRDLDLIERAAHSTKRAGAGAAAPAAADKSDEGEWVISARIEPDGSDSYMLRIVCVPPKAKSLRVRVERVRAQDIAVRGLVMVRDLLSVAPPPSPEDRATPNESTRFGVMSPLKSAGRAVLALNGALFGAYAAFSIQRAGGSDDPRLLYPLLAIGTGTGLGAALLAAEEFDVTTGDAWYLSAGAWWSAGAGVLLANGAKIQPIDDRYAWGVSAGGIGLGLATFALTRKRVDEGGATLAHSGGALGMLLGGLTELSISADLNKTPYLGSGLGTAIGVVSMGTLAIFRDVSAQRVLLVDLGAGLGALAGAAAGSPFIVGDVAQGDTVSAGKTRTFIAITGAGTIAGGALTYFLTRDKKPASPPAPSSPSNASPPEPARGAWQSLTLQPMGGMIGTSATKEGATPIYGAGLAGTF